MIDGRVIKKIVCSTALLLAAYVASYAVLRAVNYVDVIGGVGLGGNSYMVFFDWRDSTGKPRFNNTVGTVVLHFFWPCCWIECQMRRSSANKIIRPNAGGPHQFAIRAPVAARVGQFCRLGAATP